MRCPHNPHAAGRPFLYAIATIEVVVMRLWASPKFPKFAMDAGTSEGVKKAWESRHGRLPLNGFAFSVVSPFTEDMEPTSIVQ